MGHLVAVAVAVSTLGALAACGPRPGPETADLAASRGPEGRRESAGAGGGDRGALAPETIEDVMWEKVVHAQALMLGVVRADYGLVQDSATHLYRISQDTEWMVCETVTYAVFSDRFRQVAAAMAEHARQQDLDAITADYTAIVQSCVACHAYLRRERLTREYPEKISRVEPAGVWARCERAG
ncbi:MAG: hypothetical protein ACYTF2_12340 [Planctomycetota bacterium]|jgi:hypothetical protein